MDRNPPERRTNRARRRLRERGAGVLAACAVLFLLVRCDMPYEPAPAAPPETEIPEENGENPASQDLPDVPSGDEDGTPDVPGDEDGDSSGDSSGDDSGEEPGENPSGEGEGEGGPELPVLTAVEIRQPPEKLVYAKGEALDTRGIQAEGLYSDGSSRTLEAGELLFSGYDNTKSGEQIIKVSLEGKSAEFTIRVSLSELDLRITRYVPEEMSIPALPQGEITLSRSGAAGRAREFTLLVEGYEQLLCFVNGVELASADPSGGSSPVGFVLRAADYAVGRHFVTLIGINRGVPQGRELDFVVLD
jgi:hypothetical protein